MNKHIGCYGPRIDPYTFAICLTFITFPWLVRLQVRAIQCNTWVGCGTIKKTCQEVCCAHCFTMQHISNIWYGHVSTFGTALHPVFYQKILRHPPAETNQGFKQTKIWGSVKHGETMFGCPKDQQLFIFFSIFWPIVTTHYCQQWTGLPRKHLVVDPCQLQYHACRVVNIYHQNFFGCENKIHGLRPTASGLLPAAVPWGDTLPVQQQPPAAT